MFHLPSVYIHEIVKGKKDFGPPSVNPSVHLFILFEENIIYTKFRRKVYGTLKSKFRWLKKTVNNLCESYLKEKSFLEGYKKT